MNKMRNLHVDSALACHEESPGYVKHRFTDSEYIRYQVACEWS